MIEIADPGAMRLWARERRREGRRVGLVPTMGFLHEGHLRLVDHARAAADTVVLSLFVNPIQFAPGEDLGAYPRDLARDRAAAERRGVDCLFVPGVEAMYPSAPEVRVTPGTLGAHLCGAHRPGHFEGVLTVVAKLFNIVEPDVAVFGRKDVQQARLIQRMAEDLSFPTAVVVAPTVRESDGLAMSSRNSYLSEAHRSAATVLSRALDEAHRAFTGGETRGGTLVAVVRSVVRKERLVDVEYAEIVDPSTMAPVEAADARSILAVAARVGRARLIDNIVLGEGLSGDERVERST